MRACCRFTFHVVLAQVVHVLAGMIGCKELLLLDPACLTCLQARFTFKDEVTMQCILANACWLETDSPPATCMCSYPSSNQNLHSQGLVARAEVQCEV